MVMRIALQLPVPAQLRAIHFRQEALLANPFVNGKVPFREVLTRDFWGLPHDRSIGSYRPLPNIVWRALWQLLLSPEPEQQEDTGPDSVAERPTVENEARAGRP